MCFDEKYLGTIFVEVANNIVAFGNNACGLCVVKSNFLIFFIIKVNYFYFNFSV